MPLAHEFGQGRHAGERSLGGGHVREADAEPSLQHHDQFDSVDRVEPEALGEQRRLRVDVGWLQVLDAEVRDDVLA